MVLLTILNLLRESLNENKKELTKREENILEMINYLIQNNKLDEVVELIEKINDEELKRLVLILLKAKKAAESKRSFNIMSINIIDILLDKISILKPKKRSYLFDYEGLF